jgi:hypothetical protein
MAGNKCNKVHSKQNVVIALTNSTILNPTVTQKKKKKTQERPVTLDCLLTLSHILFHGYSVMDDLVIMIRKREREKSSVVRLQLYSNVHLQS